MKKTTDCYEKVLQEMETFYGETPNRCYFRQALKATLTPEECEVWILFPKHTETPEPIDKIVEKDAGTHKNVREICKSLEEKFFLIDWDKEGGVDRYVRNYIFKIGITYAEVGGEDHMMTIFFRDWFNSMVLGNFGNLPFEEGEFRVVPNEGALTGKVEDGAISMNIDIPDARETVPYDFVTEMIKKQDTICLTTCNCRVNKDVLGTRKCDYPIETCMLFGDLAARTLAVGSGKRISVEEALEITKMGRDLGLVHNISNAKDPSVLCQCCACCCLVLSSVLRGEHTNGEKSRYIACIDREKLQPEEIPVLAEKCWAKALEVVDGELVHHGSRCLGCGICAANCKSGAVSMKLRPNAEVPKADHLDILYL